MAKDKPETPTPEPELSIEEAQALGSLRIKREPRPSEQNG